MKRTAFRVVRINGAFADWGSIIAARAKVRALLGGNVGATDPLASPPAAGQEKTWLQSLLADVKADLDKVESWGTKLSADAKKKAAQVLENVKAVLKRANEAAIDYATDPQSYGAFGTREWDEQLTRVAKLASGLGLEGWETLLEVLVVLWLFREAKGLLTW